MEIYRDVEKVEKCDESVLTVGTFDGVHRGHQYIIEELKRKARSRSFKSTVVTFNPHPQLVLRPPDRPAIKLLTTIEEKVELLRAAGVDRTAVIEFTEEFSEMESVDFVRNLLYEKIGFKEIVIGYDHAFGKDREGDIDTLSRLGEELNFEVDELSAFDVEGEKVSSTVIRESLLNGKISEANRLLGRNYFLSGKVVKGDGRGQELGFPTANIEPDDDNKLIPANGVYAVYVLREGQRFKGMLNIGVRPTFDRHDRTVEVHILEFNEDIYGEILRIEFVQEIRNEKKFFSSDELVAQLFRDKELTEDLL